MKSILISLVILVFVAAVAPGQSRPAVAITSCRVVLTADSLVAPGSAFEASVQLLDTTITLGGFNLHLDYDHNALVFDSATFGASTSGEWEYIAVRTGKLTSGDSLAASSFVRIVAIADQQDQTNHHPSERSQYGPGEIARLYFYVTDDRDFRGLTLPLRFRWNKCDDNSISDKSGHILMVARSAVDAGGTSAEKAGEPFAGPAEDCIKRRYGAPAQVLDFRNSAVRIGD